jgi:uncharacterized protein (DUF1015 family)
MPDRTTHPSHHEPLRLEPFRAWRFVASKVSALGAVTSPPYDVLEPGMVRRLTEAELHNMVRLILPRDPGLGPGRYDEAAARLRSWQRDGIVVRDDRAALYVYEQQLGDATLCGLVGALKLDPTARVVLPHENVMPSWVDDRLTLMEATDADLEPILLAYSAADSSTSHRTRGLADADDGSVAGDAVDEARSGVPWLIAETDDGATHRIWRIDSPQTHARVAADLARREALIGDGHHRYAAYLHRMERHPGRPGVELGLAMLVYHARHPLTLDAIHRDLPGVSLATVTERTPAGWKADPGKLGDLAHRVLLTDGTSWLTVHRTAPRSAPTVALLHEELLPAWGVPQDRTGYHHVLADALALAAPDRLAVQLDPPLLDDVLATAARGGRLPHKATSFGPKPRVGLLLRTLD